MRANARGIHMSVRVHAFRQYAFVRVDAHVCLRSCARVSGHVRVRVLGCVVSVRVAVCVRMDVCRKGGGGEVSTHVRLLTNMLPYASFVMPGRAIEAAHLHRVAEIA